MGGFPGLNASFSSSGGTCIIGSGDREGSGEGDRDGGWGGGQGEVHVVSPNGL